MTKKLKEDPVTKEWVEIKISKSLSSYVTQYWFGRIMALVVLFITSACGVVGFILHSMQVDINTLNSTVMKILSSGLFKL